MIKSIVDKVLTVKLLTVVTLNVASAEVLAPFSTELGFNRLSHPSTPSMLIDVTDSVFEVRSISEDKVDDIQTWDLTDPKFSDVERKIDSIASLDDKERFIIKRQISNCRARGNEKQCSVLLGTEKGTAFLAGNSTLLWTNAHMVSRFIKLRATLAQKSIGEILRSDGRVAIFLFDKNGSLVFDHFTDSSAVTIYPEPSFVALLRGDWYSEDSDFVGIQLSQAIGTPFKIGMAPNEGESLYRPGFAACTGCLKNPNQTDPDLNRDRGDGRNSDGNGLYWTDGLNQGMASVNSFLGADLSGFFNMKQMIFFSADSQVGFSGGPILNNRGEVVGVFAGSKPRIYDSKMVVLSRGVRPPVFNNR